MGSLLEITASQSLLKILPLSSYLKIKEGGLGNA